MYIIDIGIVLDNDLEGVDLVLDSVEEAFSLEHESGGCGFGVRDRQLRFTGTGEQAFDLEVAVRAYLIENGFSVKYVSVYECEE